jgi:toxin CcdB
MSRQFDVFANPVRVGRDERPYLVVVQHDLYGHLTTRVTAPLVVKDAVKEPSRLHPPLRVLGKIFFLLPEDLSTLPVRYLRNPVANLRIDRDRIIAALDLVFTGI